MHTIEQIFINGEFVTPHGTEWFDLYNPATAQVMGQIRLADEVDAERAIAAAKAAFEGHTGEMVALDRISNDPYQCTTHLVDIHKIANFEKKVPLDWVNAYHTDMEPEFLQYARPLIQAELTPVYIDGLPRHIFMK